MLLPASVRVGKHVFPALVAPGSAGGFWPITPVKSTFRFEHWHVALLVSLVAVAELALFKQVRCHQLLLDDLVALPAPAQHRTLFPVVEIDRVRVELGVVPAAKVAHVVVFMKFFPVLSAVALRGKVVLIEVAF